ncbi:MAG: MBL fold metallo-hydrolase [Pseudomonadota bacterium]
MTDAGREASQQHICARLASLGSGSKGNATVVQLGGQTLLVDCGFSVRQVTQRMERLGLAPGDLDAVLITHEHADHVRGVEALAHRYAIPIYASHGTLKAAKFRLPANVINSHGSFDIGGVRVIPVAVPHDAREPTQFVFEAGGCRVGVLSDLGCVTPHVISHYRDCDLLMMESNHDPEMLRNGRYPPSLKRRVGGQLGHLSNAQAADLLGQVGHAALRVVVGHVSEQNNSLANLEATFAPFVGRLASLEIADQAAGVAWQELAPQRQLDAPAPVS